MFSLLEKEGAFSACLCGLFSSIVNRKYTRPLAMHPSLFHFCSLKSNGHVEFHSSEVAEADLHCTWFAEWRWHVAVQRVLNGEGTQIKTGDSGQPTVRHAHGLQIQLISDSQQALTKRGRPKHVQFSPSRMLLGYHVQ